MEEDIIKGYSISKDYESHEFPSHYKDFLMGSFLVQDGFTVECLQKIYSSDRVKGTRLLDFGCGPTVHRIASASLRFDEIILSEWSEANRKEMEKWLKGEKDALDWTILLERCAMAEGFRDIEKGVAEFEKRIRETVKKVVPCDALADDILPEGLGEFDVITSTFCLESCCFSNEIFKNSLKKLTKHLKKGGVLVMASVMQVKSYILHKEVPGFYLTEDAIKEAINEVGLELRDWFYWKDTEHHDSFEYGGTAIYYCIKL